MQGSGWHWAEAGTGSAGPEEWGGLGGRRVVGGEVWEGPGQTVGTLGPPWGLGWPMGRLCGSELASAGSWCTFLKERSAAGQKSKTHSREAGRSKSGRREQCESSCSQQVSGDSGPDQSFWPWKRDGASQGENPRGGPVPRESAGPQAADLWPGAFNCCHQLSLALVSSPVP